MGQLSHYEARGIDETQFLREERDFLLSFTRKEADRFHWYCPLNESETSSNPSRSLKARLDYTSTQQLLS
jgi:hypothetical protein